MSAEQNAFDEALTLAWRGGLPLPDICRATKLYPAEVGDHVRRLGLPDRHPTTREIEQPEFPLPMEPKPYAKAARIAEIRASAAG